MKLLLVLTLVFLSMSVLAKSLEEKKTKLISGLDQKISQLQKTKSCIQQAQDEKSLSKCRRPNRSEKLRKKLKGAAKPREQKVEKK